MPRPHSTESNHFAVAANLDQSALQRQEKEDEETLQQAKTATARLGQVIGSRAYVLSLVRQAAHQRCHFIKPMRVYQLVFNNCFVFSEVTCQRKTGSALDMCLHGY